MPSHGRGGFFIMFNSGYILLHRKIQSWGWYKSSETLHLFIHLLISANFRDSEYMGLTIKRGSLIFGRKKASEITGISERSIRTALKRLKSTSELTIKTTNKFSIITICNYDSYQPLISELDQQNDQQNDQQTTSKRPASDQQATTSEEELNNNKKRKTPEVEI